jgi:hypothetical protein
MGANLAPLFSDHVSSFEHLTDQSRFMGAVSHIGWMVY